MSRKRRIASLASLLLIIPFTNTRGDTMDDALEEARQLMKSGKPAEAKPKLEALKSQAVTRLKTSPNDAHAHYILGTIRMYASEDADAEKSLDNAVTLEPSNSTYQTARGSLAMFQQKPAQALPYFRRAAQLTPASLEALQNLASAQSLSKDYTGALETLQRSARVAPKDARILGMMGEVYISMDKPDAALEHYGRALALDPAYAKAHFNVGQLHQNAGRHKESLAAFAEVLKLNPADWRAISKQVQLYEAMHETKERDAARDRLIALWKDKKVADSRFCREQFTFNDTQVFAFEHFELVGENAVRYTFGISDKDGKLIRQISLGSYESTNAIARETGSLKPNERLFHLDDYTQSTHATLGMFKTEPSYEETRALVIEALEKKLVPASTLIVPSTKGQ